MSAPHLPPKSCNVKTHNRLLALPVIIFLTLLSLFSGMTAALVTSTWIIPSSAPEQMLFASSGFRSNNSTFDPTVLNQTRQRTVDLYDTSKNVSPDIYTDNAFVGHAMLLSSDGWAVASVPYRVGKEKIWLGLDYQGVKHEIERVVTDPVTGLVYLKLSGDGFRIVPFDDFENLDENLSLWNIKNTSAVFREGDIRPVNLTKAAKRTDAAVFPISQAEYAFGFEQAIESGGIVLTDRGDLVGFVDANHRLLPGWFVGAALSSLLESGKISYKGIAADVSIVNGFYQSGNIKMGTGLYVSRVRSTSLGQSLKKGDIILRINNKPIDPAYISREIYLGSSDLSITIWRDNAEVDVLAKKTLVP